MFEIFYISVGLFFRKRERAKRERAKRERAKRERAKREMAQVPVEVPGGASAKRWK